MVKKRRLGQKNAAHDYAVHSATQLQPQRYEDPYSHDNTQTVKHIHEANIPRQSDHPGPQRIRRFKKESSAPSPATFNLYDDLLQEPWSIFDSTPVALGSAVELVRQDCYFHLKMKRSAAPASILPGIAGSCHESTGEPDARSQAIPSGGNL